MQAGKSRRAGRHRHQARRTTPAATSEANRTTAPAVRTSRGSMSTPSSSACGRKEVWCQLGAVAACFLFKYLLQVTQLACARYRSERNKTLACTDMGAEPGSKERSSPAVEPQASAHAQQHPKQQQQLAPRSSAHCDIRAAAAQEVTGRSGHGGGGSGARCAIWGCCSEGGS